MNVVRTLDLICLEFKMFLIITLSQQVSSTQTNKNVLKYFAHINISFYANNTGDHYLGSLLAGLDPY